MPAARALCKAEVALLNEIASALEKFTKALSSNFLTYGPPKNLSPGLCAQIYLK